LFPSREENNKDGDDEYEVCNISAAGALWFSAQVLLEFFS